MMKLLATSALFVLVYTAPSYAQTAAPTAAACDEATMTQMTTQLDALSDPAMQTNKDMATRYMGAAKTAMGANDTAACATQLNMARMSMTMKCDDASMAMMKTEMDAMVDPAMKANKDEAMSRMELATTAMTGNKLDECVGYMGQAMEAMNKKM